jgi:hypothetical protein
VRFAEWNEYASSIQRLLWSEFQIVMAIIPAADATRIHCDRKPRVLVASTVG